MAEREIIPGELLCSWELFALEWSWTQDSFAGDLEGEVKHQPSCSEGGCRVIHNIADLLLILAVWDSGWVCSISSSQWVSSSFRFYESWAFCLSFVAQGVCCFCSLPVLPGLEAVGGKYGSQAIFVSLLHVQPIVCADLQQLQGHYQK